jgi:hypothetical protein
MNTYKTGTPRALVGLAAAFMTVATLAVAVLAPAAMDSTSRDVSVATTSSASQGAPDAHSGALTTSIDVVALRTTRLVPVVHTRAQFRTDLSS